VDDSRQGHEGACVGRFRGGVVVLGSPRSVYTPGVVCTILDPKGKCIYSAFMMNDCEHVLNTRANAVGYIRVSTDEQKLGPLAQRDAIEHWATRQGVTIVAWYEDRGVSGTVPAYKRPGLMDAITALDSHTVLAVAKRDRLSRDALDSILIEKQVAKRGGRIVSAAGEGTADDGPSQQLFRRITDAFSEYEVGLIRQRTRAALAAKRARGEKTGGDIPYGYKLDSDGKTLVKSEEGAGLDLILELRAGGMSIRKIAAELNNRGVKPRGSKWHGTTVARILKRAA